MRVRFHRRLAVSSAMTLASFVACFVSCATNDEAGTTNATNDGSVVPESSQAEVDASSDAGCDASDPQCVAELVPCDRVDWCSVPTHMGVLSALAAVWGTSKDDVWAVGSVGTILHYDGVAWTPTPSGVRNTFYGIWGSGPNDIWVVSSSDVVLHGTGFKNGVAGWEPVSLRAPLSTPSILRAVWGSSASDVRMGGRSYQLIVPDRQYFGYGNQFVMGDAVDGGASWRPLPGTATVTSIWGSSANDVWMTADNSASVSYERGTILHGTLGDASAEAGPLQDRLSWAPVDSRSTLTLESVWGSSASDVWAVGAFGTIRHFGPGDDRWQEVDSPTKATLHSVWGTGPNDVWAVGDGGTILHYDGTSFEPSTAQFAIGRKPNLNGVWGSGPNDVWIVGDGVALHYTGAKSAKAGGDQ
ncbi:Type IV fimbrial biogenesis protein PilY1 [Labilithrix luteola]|uniref:Type IV fimbrial biogenesis protein PilY1 n=1 Tax=Labilithrix luteola TaxID=1391654 RepID=A0A0K1Q0D9_9BACT|nr:hypothetical protein [Labilithrix luteola]AKU99116.1 Type IV fimbrial biogenesis protein PilY1 [Labilithrix luteola]